MKNQSCRLEERAGEGRARSEATSIRLLVIVLHCVLMPLHS